jgi:hypothetical protein
MFAKENVPFLRNSFAFFTSFIPRIKIRRYKTYRSYGTASALQIVITNRLIIYTKNAFLKEKPEP